MKESLEEGKTYRGIKIRKKKNNYIILGRKLNEAHKLHYIGHDMVNIVKDLKMKMGRFLQGRPGLHDFRV